VELAGRVALVTGAGRRLGRAFATALAGRGAAIASHYHGSRGGAEALRAEVIGAGGSAECFQADLGDAAAAQSLAGRVIGEMGRLDVLVNSAAVMHKVSFAATTPALFDDVMQLNLRSAFFVTQGAAQELTARRGKVVNIADLAGLEPWPGYAVHSLSKAGIVMLTRVLALTLAPHVTVNAIAPGAVLVPEDSDEAERRRLADSTPLGRLGEPRDVVEALLYVVEQADFMTGQVLVVDGGRVLR
jgi:pteridine reductase